MFSYGTLQLTAVRLSQFGRRLDSSPDALPGYRVTTIQITDPAVIEAGGTDRHPLVVASPDPEDAVEGHVFALTETELAAAEAYEVDDYARVRVILRSGTQAWAHPERATATQADAEVLVP
ncbi:UDP-N-acetylmuramate--alanine ligase [Streptomyces sp. IMTB 2501]|uniref:gamma-glutamylcyclotransferase family protein n=1 Tax=Streptomyces sp. IMTB 2501 TaxID=1776340 RepID=UPI00096F6841|nr:gamma-glutamylcyclotransferase family protein [Streptomyces sp. IMTB 2501]OLZ68907.1 UDP-N-acetylmuramate--alanine ligase [Streptomyces sp. IMTB 2501]